MNASTSSKMPLCNNKDELNATAKELCRAMFDARAAKDWVVCRAAATKLADIAKGAEVGDHQLISECVWWMGGDMERNMAISWHWRPHAIGYIEAYIESLQA